MIRLFVQKVKYIIFVFITFNECIRFQPLPKESFLYSTNQILYNAGTNWNNLSTIYRYKWCHSKSGKNDKNFFGQIFNIYSKNNDLFFGAHNKWHFKDNFYSFLNFNFAKYNNINSFTSEASGMGFRNNWVNLQIGKGNEDWGAGNDISLCLNHISMPYDYILLTSDYGRVRVSYIYGFLEKDFNDYNRYINARGLEWTNNKSLIVSFTETVVYSGLKRPFEISYLNPIASHLEVELNNRLNNVGSQNANAVWQTHIDLLLNKKIRISINYLIDEFVIDKDVEINKEHGSGYSIKTVYNFLSKKDHILNVFFSKISIGTPTFRHSNGSNNFVNKGLPLGVEYGSDFTDLSFGFNYLKLDRVILRMKFQKTLIGQESITNNPYLEYSDYKKGIFPSGEISSNEYLKMELKIKINKLFTIYSNLSLNTKNKLNLEENFNFGLFLNK